MKIYEIMRSKQYKKILINFFQDDIKFINKFPSNYFDSLKDLCESNDLEDNAFKAIKIAQHTEFCFVLDDREVGVFCNKYIVAFNAGVAGFDFIGDNISNWLDYFGSESDTSESDSFKLLCHQEFNTPIIKYDRWDTSHFKLIESILKD